MPTDISNSVPSKGHYPAACEVTLTATVEHVSSDLIDRIEAQHAAATLKGFEMVCALIECGESLIEARKRVPHGEWNRWIESNLTLHPKTVRTYVRFATYQHELRKHQPVSVNDARRLLSEKSFVQVNDASHLKERARNLREQGWTYERIATELGVTKGAVQHWFYGAEKAARQRQLSKSALRIQREKERKRAVGRKGGNASIAYGHIRKAVQALDDAIRTEPKATRALLVTALSACYRAEDHIVQASKKG